MRRRMRIMIHRVTLHQMTLHRHCHYHHPQLPMSSSVDRTTATIASYPGNLAQQPPRAAAHHDWWKVPNKVACDSGDGGGVVDGDGLSLEGWRLTEEGAQQCQCQGHYWHGPQPWRQEQQRTTAVWGRGEGDDGVDSTRLLAPLGGS